MRAHTDYLWFNTTKRHELINITDRVAEIVAASRVQEGLCLVSAMWVACSSPATFAEAGELGLGALCFTFGTPSEIAPLIKSYKDAIKRCTKPVGAYINDNIAVTTNMELVVHSLYNNKGILGCRYGAARPRRDFPMLADLYLAGRLRIDELITDRYPLDDFDRALHDLEEGRLARGVFQVGQEH